MANDYSKLIPGQEISRHTYHLNETTISAYIIAVGDKSKFQSENDKSIVPPMAIAALSLRGAINALKIPGGTLHSSQEVEFQRLAFIGELVECATEVTQNSTRGSWRFLIITSKVHDEKGNVIMEGKSTIMLPLSTNDPTTSK